MIFRRTCIVASALIMLGTLGAPSGPTKAQARRVVARDGNVLTGELVIIKGTRNRFRLVGHGGTFAAPAGTSLEPFDGKPVEVEFGRGGTVLAITEEPVHIEPITHGFEVVTGELIVNDPVTGTFSLAGADRVYIAPAATDIRPYAGRMVNVRLDERGRVMGIDAAAQAVNTTSPCTYGGYSYSEGESVCDAGTPYRCEAGTWRRFGPACGSEGKIPAASPECVVGDARVASGSSICRGGTTFRCVDGHWLNIGTVCG